MKTLSTIVPAAVLAVLAGSTLAQSINIDVNRSSSAVVPTASFAGAGGQAGVWNNVFAGTSGTVSLVGLDGLSTNVTLTRAGSGGGDSQSISGASADFATLMSDFQMTTGVVQGPEFTINGLAAGYYRVYVYASLPGAAGFYTDSFGAPVYYTNYVSLTVGGQAAGSAATSGALVANTFTQGVSHAKFDVAVPAGAPALKVSVKTGSGSNEKCALNGLQIVKFPGTRLYVDGTKAAGAQTGESWATAVADLQTALTIARNSGGHITEIWVARGVYYPTANTDRTKSFQLVSGVKLHGGFAGTETSLAQRDLADPANTTYLSGDIGTRRVSSDNSYHVVTGVNLGSATLLEGISVVSGRANGVLASGQQDGSLIYLTNSSPTVKNCYFTGGDSQARGGAIFAQGGVPQIVGCTFYDNWGHWQGGGVYWTPTTGPNPASIRITNCEFISNESFDEGSAFHMGGGNPVVANCVFTGNTGDTIVGIDNVWNTDILNVYNSTFSGNTGSVFGSVQGAGQNFYNCIIWNNDRLNVSNTLAKTGWDTAYAASTQLVNTTIQGYTAASVPGIGNNGQDPQFVNAAGDDGVIGNWDDDLRLSAFSPMIDQGLNAYAPLDVCDMDADGNTSEPAPFDLDGNTRFFNVPFAADGIGFGNRIDRGAYEAQYTVAPCGTSDFNGDGDFGTDQDIEAFFACLAGSCCSTCFPNGSDFNSDGDYGTDQDIEAFFRVLAGGNC